MKLMDMRIPDAAALGDCCNQKRLIVKKHVMVKNIGFCMTFFNNHVFLNENTSKNKMFKLIQCTVMCI